MAQMTESLARAILNGDGCTRHELEQLCRHFLATPAGSASGDDALDYQMAASAEAAEVDRRGKRIAALQAEVARLRELATLIVNGAMPATTSGATCFVPRYQIDKLRAAMGGANGQADAAALHQRKENSYSDGPVWQAFGLTYAAYAVFPRRALQSMPRDWQERFVALVNEMHAALPAGTFDGDYTVTLRVNGRIAKDPLREYRHTGPLLRADAADTTAGDVEPEARG